MNVDEILRQIGEFGVYQKVIYVSINILGITHGIRMLIAVFLIHTPPHRCALPSYPNDTYEIQSDYHASLIRQFIPNNTKDAENGPYDQCHIYASSSDNDSSTTVGCERWVYDKTLFESTAAVEFNMVCDDSLLGSHSQTSQMGGYMFGVLFFGAIGDKWGRKVALYLAVLVYLGSGLGLSWTPLANYYVFVLLRFFNGACSAGAYTAACVLSVELVGPSKRLWVGVLIHTAFATGGLVLDLIGYFIRDWFLINIVGTAPVVLALSFWWILPESPRWLAKKGRMTEAQKILRKIARYNGKLFPEGLLRDVAETANHTEEGVAITVNPAVNNGTANSVMAKTVNPTINDDTTREGVAYKATNSTGSGERSDEGVAKPAIVREGVSTTALSTNSNGVSQKDNSKTSGTLKQFLKMFTYRVLLVRSLILFLNWFAVSMTYFGLSIAADQLAVGDLFTSFLLSMSMDFPATALSLLLLDRWGRRRLQTVTMVVSGVACLLGVLTTLVAPADYQWATVVVAMVGKLGSSAGFIMVYIYSSELFPTIVRSAGLGMSSAFARVGGIVASYVQQWSLEMGGDLGKALPLLVFGAFSLVGGLLTSLLPETLHKDLPDTIEEGLKFGRNPDKDEGKDPTKVVDVFSIGDVQAEMETFESIDVLLHPSDTREHSGTTPVLANDKEVLENVKDVHVDAKENHEVTEEDSNHTKGDHDYARKSRVSEDTEEQNGTTSPGTYVKDACPDPVHKTKKVNFVDSPPMSFTCGE